MELVEQLAADSAARAAQEAEQAADSPDAAAQPAEPAEPERGPDSERPSRIPEFHSQRGRAN